MQNYTVLIAINCYDAKAANAAIEQAKNIASDDAAVHILGTQTGDILENMSRVNNAAIAFNRKKREETQSSFTFPTNDESKTTHKGK